MITLSQGNDLLSDGSPARKLKPGCRARHMLQLTCTCGSLTPTVAQAANTCELHLMDVVVIQLHAAQRKVPPDGKLPLYARINVEALLAYAGNSLDSVVIFFLLHELPLNAQQRTLREALRVLKPGGHLLIAEYGMNRGRHLLHRLAPLRWILEKWRHSWVNSGTAISIHNSLHAHAAMARSCNTMAKPNYSAAFIK